MAQKKQSRIRSTYHHSNYFEPIKGLIKVPCRDTLIGERKDWKGGIELLFQ